MLYPTISPYDGSYWGTGVATAARDGGRVDKLAFLRLLVTELKNQNPMDPVDNREFLAQLAQFNALEQMQNLNEQVQGLAEHVSQLKAVEVANGARLDAIKDALAGLLAAQGQLQPLA